jgi:DNA polymerase III alpha subunit
MKNLVEFDSRGAAIVSDQGIIELAYQNKLNNSLFEWQNQSSRAQFEQVCELLDLTPVEFLKRDINSRQWFTPEPYASIDLESHVLSRCANSTQIARAKTELALIKNLNAEIIFRHLIYLVDLWRSKNLIWGVGRGSSVSCFVLYLIGVNKINPLDYDLDCSEFFKTSGSKTA